jgi:CrcB protein
MDTALSRFLWIGLGGATGTWARWLLSGWLLRTLGTSFPYGTLAVNVIGSFLLGAVMIVGTQTEAIPETARLALTVGVMGGFTTYSTFNYETIE